MDAGLLAAMIGGSLLFPDGESSAPDPEVRS